jgi:hypothetical protein
MSGFTNFNTNLSTGAPARHIGPETGSSGDATMSNQGETSEGVNQSPDSHPAPAAGLEAPMFSGEHKSDTRGFQPAAQEATPFDPDVESPAQQIADGGDHLKHRDPNEGRNDKSA